MNIDQFIVSLENLATRIRLNVKERAIIAANDLKALIENRVVQTGKDEKGASFTPYSTNGLAAWKLKGKSRRQSAEQKITALAKAGETISYKDFRELNGLKTNKKNFEFTGDMWKNTGIIEINDNNGNVRVEIGGQTPNAKDKLDWNSEREGKSIAEPSQKEIKFIENKLDNWITDLIIQTLT